MLTCLERLFSKSFLLFKSLKIVYQVLSVQYWGFQRHSLGRTIAFCCQRLLSFVLSAVYSVFVTVKISNRVERYCFVTAQISHRALRVNRLFFLLFDVTVQRLFFKVFFLNNNILASCLWCSKVILLSNLKLILHSFMSN